ncbi:MAG: glycosyltransferase family 1 protein [Acidobacteriota bacterium]|nr:glycosyltransferase family 1 protein [Acidobacteriota bacterium]
MATGSQSSTPRGPLPVRAYRRLRYLLSRLRPWRLRATWLWLWAALAKTRELRREERLTVAVDICAFWEPLTGIGWYLYRLLEHLAHRDDLRLRLYGPQIAPIPDAPEPVVELPAGPALEVVRYDAPEDLSLPPWRLAQIVQRLQPLLLAIHRNRVVFAPNFFAPRRFLFCRGALVATIHDLAFREVPWTLREKTLEDLETRLDKTLDRAAHLITPSEAVRQEMVEEELAPPERVHAVLHGPGQLSAVEPGTPPENTPRSFCLHVGTLEPRKNLGTVLAAWRELRKRGVEVPALVLCGKRGWKAESLDAELEAGISEGWLLRFGYLANEELAALYHRARAVVFPTLYEGFGLPAVEAQQAGAPLVCSDLPVLREVAGDGALYAPPEDPQAWADALQGLFSNPDLAQNLATKGTANAQRFSWQRAAEETLKVWRQAADAGQSGSLHRRTAPTA